MYDLKKYEMEEMYNEVDESPKILAMLKNIIFGSTNLVSEPQLKIISMQISQKNKEKILNTIIKLAEIDQLSEEKFRLLMIAFSTQ